MQRTPRGVPLVCSVSLFVLVLSAVPLEAQVQSISDDPCPVGAFTLQSHLSWQAYSPFTQEVKLAKHLDDPQSGNDGVPQNRRPFFTPARPLKKGEKLLLFTVGKFEFDDRNAAELAADQKADSWYGWAVGAIGLNHRSHLSVVVPLQYVDRSPTSEPATPTGREFNAGDLTAGFRFSLTDKNGKSEKDEHKAASAFVRLTLPTDADLLGSGNWSGQAGLIADRVWDTDHATVVPYASIWAVWREGGGLRAAFALGSDIAVNKYLGFFGGAAAEDAERGNDPADGFVGAHLGGYPPGHHFRLDGTLTVRWPFNGSPDPWYLASAQLSWD